MEVYLTKCESKIREKIFKEKDRETVSVLEANGSVESIRDWARGAKLDRLQKKAFFAIIASFILTLFDDNEEDDMY